MAEAQDDIAETVATALDRESIRSLRMKRAQLKAACTKLKNYLDTSVSDDVSINELSNRRAKLEEHLRHFDEVQSKLDMLEMQGNEEYVSPERMMFEENYYRLAARLDDLITARSTVTNGNLHVVASQNTASVTDQSLNSQVRLPRITLPTFTGRYEEWYSFYDMFNSLIHACPTIPAVQKFQYLKASLKEEAADVISSFEISCENYLEAWKILKERYDNRRKIIQNHVKAIYELPTIKKDCSVTLRQLLDGLTKHLRALNALQLPTEHWDALLLYIISSKVDLSTNMEWETSLQGTDLPKMTDFIDFLTRRCHALEASSRKPQATSVPQNSPKLNRKKCTSSHVSTSKVYCSICKGDHFLGKCDKFINMPVDKRRQELLSKKLCLNCMRSTSHFAKDCKFGTCKKCNRRHNTMLHEENFTGSQSSEPAAKQMRPEEETRKSRASPTTSHMSQPFMMYYYPRLSSTSMMFTDECMNVALY